MKNKLKILNITLYWQEKRNNFNDIERPSIDRNYLLIILSTWILNIS